MGISDWSSDVCSSDLVIDHAAEAGSGLRDTDTLHRIDPAIVKQQVVAAGFEFVGEGPVLANAQDDHTLKVFDPKVRGTTDSSTKRSTNTRNRGYQPRTSRS